MEKLGYLTEQQKTVLLKFSQSDFLKNTFYFSGGTALSAVYLQHRYSDDLDFFSTHKFDGFAVLAIAQTWASELKIELASRSIGNIYNLDLKFSPEYSLQVEFVDYPYQPIEKLGVIEGLGIKTESYKDIAINKFMVVSQRADIKDFIDLYFILKDFSVYELFELSNKKFKRDYDLLLFAADLLKVEKFDYLPRMVRPVDLAEVKHYFVDLAQKLGIKTTAR